MCTIIALYGVSPLFPLVIAANRDEYYSRASGGPQLLSMSPRAIGGIDHEKGGTWMGANERGIFVGLTNQRTYQLPAKEKESRGQVVLEALKRETPEEIARYLMQLDPRAYNPFNLLFGSASDLRVAYSRHEREKVVIEPVPRGLQVLPNDELNSSHFLKVKRALSLAEPLLQGDWPSLVSGLSRVLGDHALPPLQEISPPPPGSLIPRALARQLEALCIHTPLYGTRSSTILALEEGRVAHYLYAAGPPCRTAFEEVSGLLFPLHKAG